MTYRSKPIYVEAYQYCSIAAAPAWVPDSSAEIGSKTDWAVRAENGEVKIFSDAEFQDTFEGAPSEGDTFHDKEFEKSAASIAALQTPETAAPPQGQAPAIDQGWIEFERRRRALQVNKARLDLALAELNAEEHEKFAAEQARRFDVPPPPPASFAGQ